MEKKYLITGGAGFIGSNFILHLRKKEKNAYIINLDKLTYAGNLKNLSLIEKDKNYKFIQGDICDKELVSWIFLENNIDYVINFAAESHVDRSILEPEIFVRTNIQGTLNMLQCAKCAWEIGEDQYKKGVRFLQISTDEVYGSLGKMGLFHEGMTLSPSSPYAASKASGDLLVQAYYKTYKMPINISRCSNNYGPRQFPEKLIPRMFYNALNGNPLSLYGDGLQIRDWLYVKDHCSALEKILSEGAPGEIYNVGGNNEKTNEEIVKTITDFINKYTGLTLGMKDIIRVADRKGHDRRYGINATKIRENLGWRPETTFETGMEETLKWYKENPKWLEEAFRNSMKEDLPV